MEGEEGESTPLIVHRRNSGSLTDGGSRKIRWLAILLGQLLSILLCLSAVTSVYLATVYDLNLPTFQNFLFYVILAAVFTSAVACRSVSTLDSQGTRQVVGSNFFSVIKARGWRYFLLALCDAEANFLVVKAYQYTTLTSVQLLDCFTIPTVLLLSRFLLGTKYRIIHITGVVICLGGVACLVWADIEDGKPFGQGNDRVMGDMFCLLGAFLYGVSNVAQEFLVKTFDMVEFLGMIGFFGALITGFQACILEWDQISGAASVPSTSSLFAIIGLLIGFALTQFTFYILAARLMKISGATMYNLSILTADFYSILVGIFLFHYDFHSPLYFVAFVLVLGGVLVFSIKPTSMAHSVASVQEEQHINSDGDDPVTVSSVNQE